MFFLIFINLQDIYQKFYNFIQGNLMQGDHLGFLYLLLFCYICMLWDRMPLEIVSAIRDKIQKSANMLYYGNSFWFSIFSLLLTCSDNSRFSRVTLSTANNKNNYNNSSSSSSNTVNVLRYHSQGRSRKILHASQKKKNRTDP